MVITREEAQKIIWILREGKGKPEENCKVITGKVVRYRCSRRSFCDDGRQYEFLKRKRARRKCVGCRDLQYIVVEEKFKDTKDEAVLITG